jgi:hypothetical protein
MRYILISCSSIIYDKTFIKKIEINLRFQILRTGVGADIAVLISFVCRVVSGVKPAG